MPARKRPYLVSATFRPDVTIDHEAYPFNILAEIRYEDTEHYAVTRDFLNNYGRRLERLLSDEEEA